MLIFSPEFRKKSVKFIISGIQIGRTRNKDLEHIQGTFSCLSSGVINFNPNHYCSAF